VARRPARSGRSKGRKKGRKGARKDTEKNATPIWLNPLAIASLVLVLALGGVGAWLTLTFEEPVREPIEIVADIVAIAPPPEPPPLEPEPGYFDRLSHSQAPAGEQETAGAPGTEETAPPAAELAPVEAADATEPRAEEQPTADVAAAAPAEPTAEPEPEPEDEAPADEQETAGAPGTEETAPPAAELAPVEAADATEPQAEEQPTADVAAAAPAEPTAEPDAEPEPEERQVAALPPADEERGLPPLAPEPGVQMVAAPDPDLVLEGENGLLPVIGEDGREPWQVYARPFTEDTGQPRVAILLANLGLSQSATNAAIQQLPGGVSLSFTPYARSLDLWIAEARAAGHEVFLELPMEPFNYPALDPGPHTLLTTLPFANEESSAPFDDNQARLDWLLSRFSGYVGVTNFLGDKFISDPESLTPVLESLRDRGLMFLNARTAPSSVAGQLAADLALPQALNNRFIDNEASRVAIDARLFELERIAKSEGTAVGIGFPYPVTLERVARWVPTLREKGIVLAPISAVVSRPAE
jgi:hypothetical protein